MPLVIERVSAATPALAAFLADHHADMDSTAPPESQHALPLTRLLAPEVRLFAMYVDAELVATGALAPIEAGHEELKSMRTDPTRRGAGLGTRMLGFLLEDAAARGIRRVSLETGSDEFFRPAHRLYTRSGFVDTDPFGSYRPDPHSLFLTRVIAQDG
jgi:putative acetyltransferase